MCLNIENERVHQLAREAAARTGRSETSVIELALEELLASLPAEQDRRPQHMARALAIAEDFGARLSPEQRAALATDDLHDDSGLPS